MEEKGRSYSPESFAIKLLSIGMVVIISTLGISALISPPQGDLNEMSVYDFLGLMMKFDLRVLPLLGIMVAIFVPMVRVLGNSLIFFRRREFLYGLTSLTAGLILLTLIPVFA